MYEGLCADTGMRLLNDRVGSRRNVVNVPVRTLDDMVPDWAISLQPRTIQDYRPGLFIQGYRPAQDYSEGVSSYQKT